MTAKDKDAKTPSAAADVAKDKDTPSKDASQSNNHKKDDREREGSAATASGVSGSAQVNDAASAAASSSALTAAAVLEYLKNRGFQRSEMALKAEMKALAAGKSPEDAQAEGTAAIGAAGNRTMSLEELAAKSAPKDAGPTDKTAEGKEKTFEELATEALKIDKTDRIRGFGMVRNWCEGGLDVYQAELRPLLLPLFVHAYIDLIEMGSESAAFSLYAVHSSALLPQHLSLLSRLRSVTLPSHVSDEELISRFRSERFVLKMSQTVFGLLLGWLTDGTGPVAAAGAAEGVGGDMAEAPATRGRLAMLRIINERCRIQVLRAKPYELTAAILEEGTGLTGTGLASSSTGRPSRQYPALQANAVSEGGDAIAEFNAKNAGPQLKLGPALPLNERLKEEVQREVEEELKREEEERKRKEEAEGKVSGAENGGTPLAGEQAMEGVESGEAQGEKAETEESGKAGSKAKDGTPSRATETPGPGGKGTASVAPPTTTAKEAASLLPSAQAAPSDLLQPALSDLPPQPPLFRTVDIMREVARVRDARKSLRIDLRLLSEGSGPSSAIEDVATQTRRAALPSICAYTFHDVEDGLACSTFSEDVSLMAAGFEESYVQVWSLKGEPLRGLRGGLSLSSVRDVETLSSQRNQGVDDLPTRKLVGHSAPVYSLSFDPLGGSASAPRTLLSASGDSTVRLWSMDTFSALVSYRGHQGPVWDVEYGPSGIYFATAGMDKTARLWSTERINPLRMYVGHLSDVDCLSFHPNSLYLATGSSDRTCRLWDVQRGACVRLFVGHSSPVSVVKVSPDGRYLASAGSGSPSHFAGPNPGLALGSEEEATISIWDLGSGRRVKKMWGHTARVHSLDFSNDGSLLVSTANDCTVRCWDVKSAGGTRTGGSMHQSASSVPVPVPGEGAKSPLLKPGSVKGGKTNGLGKAGAPDTGKVGGEEPVTTVAGPGSAAADVADGGSSAASADAWASSLDCVATFRTKKTPMVDVKMTRRNLCLVAGGYDESL